MASTPKSIYRALWSHTLVAQMNARGISARALAKAAQIGKTTIERFCDPNDSTIPRPETLRELLRVSLHSILLDDEGLTARLWDDEAQVMDWMNLLGWRGSDTLCALREDSQLFTEEHGWWRPLGGIPQPSPAYCPRDLESDLQRAVVLPQGFRQPRYAVILVQGELADARDLVARLMQNDAEWRDHFRDGRYWLEAQGLDAREAMYALVEMLAFAPKERRADGASLPVSPHAWLTWAAAPGRNALIVLNEPSVETVSALLSGVGPQIQFIVITSPEAQVAPVISRIVGADRVCTFELAGYSANEVMRLAKMRQIPWTAETQQQLEVVRQWLHGDAVRVRATLELFQQDEPITPERVYRHLVEKHLIVSAPDILRCEADTIERPGLMALIRQAVRASTQQPIVLHGASGSGKTTLLKQIAHDSELRLQFPDGVVQLEPQRREDAQTLSEFQIAMLLPQGKQVIGSRERLIQQVQVYWRGKRQLLFLDHWHAANLVRELQQWLAPTSLIIVATQSVDLAPALHLPPSRVIQVEGFTREETEAYVARRYALSEREWTEAERRHLPALYYELTRGHPSSLALQVNHGLAHGQGTPETDSVQPIAASGFAETLSRALTLAYQGLTPEAQACFRRLGALPELRMLDRFTFTALWSSESELKAEEILRQLDTQAGLLRRHYDVTGKPYWTIHQAVWDYARRLYQADVPSERQHAVQWLDRAIAAPSQQERYRSFRRQVDRLGWRTWLRYFLAHAMPTRKPLWLRVANHVINPNWVTEWAVIQDHARYFTSAEFALAYQLYREERRTHILISLLVCALGGLIVLKSNLAAPRWTMWIGFLAFLWFVAIGVLLLRLLTAEPRRIPAWRTLWLIALERMQSPPSNR